MINLVKVLESSIDALNRRLVKVLRLGKSDIQTPFAVAPYGVDSNPIKDMIAVYSDTGEKGKTVIIGYINKNQIADKGELRLFSTDSLGVEKKYIWLKNDNTIEIGGDIDNMVRYSALATAFNILLTDLNAARAALSLPPSIADISGSKINEIKTL